MPALLHVSNLTFWQPYSFYSDTQAENFVLYSLIMAIANLILFCLNPYSLPSKPSSPDDLVSTASFVWPSLSLLLSQTVFHISQNSCLGLLPSSAHAIPLLTEHSPSVTHNRLAWLEKSLTNELYAACSMKTFSYASKQDPSPATPLSLSSKYWYARCLYATHSRKSLNLLLPIPSELTSMTNG